MHSYQIAQLTKIPSFLFLLLPGVLVATSDATPKYGDQTPIKEMAIQWITDKKSTWGESIGSAGQRLDSYFVNEDYAQKVNRSFLKVGFETTALKAGEFEAEPIIGFRLHLPTLEERLKIVIESQANEIKGLTDSDRESQKLKSEEIKNETTGALKLETKKYKNWRASTSVGVEIKNPPDTFWRAKYHYLWPLNERWQLKFYQSIYYFHVEGWGERSYFEWERSGNEYVYRTKSQAKYTHNERTLEFAQTFTWLKELSPIRAIKYQLGIIGENRPKPNIKELFANLTYRRKILDTWLYYEIEPELSYIKNPEFEYQPSLTFRLEWLISPD